MRHPHANKGFTLIEILVVGVIVAIVISTALLSINLSATDQDLKREAIRFAALLEVLNDEASMQGREFGIEIMRSGYRFVEYDPFGNQWAEVPLDDTFRMRSLPEDVEFELVVEDKRIVLEEAPAAFGNPDDDDVDGYRKRDPANDYSPHLLVYSSGDVTPFELHLLRRFDNARVRLRGDALGSVRLLGPDEE